MALTALANIPGKEARSDFGAPVFLGVIAGVLGGSPYIWRVDSPWNGVVKGLAFCFGLVFVIILAEAIQKLFSVEARRVREATERRLGDKVFAGVIGVAALATAVINLVAAVRSKK